MLAGAFEESIDLKPNIDEIQYLPLVFILCSRVKILH